MYIYWQIEPKSYYERNSPKKCTYSKKSSSTNAAKTSTQSIKKMAKTAKQPLPQNRHEVNNYKSQELMDALKKSGYKAEIKITPLESTQKIQSRFETNLHSIIKPNDVKRAVLGIDIYKYSQFDYDKQKIIPALFEIIRKVTESFFIRREPFFSNRYTKQLFENDLIHTGDGGFLFFQNPIDALVFLLQFNCIVHLFNSHHIFAPLRRYINEPLTLRYAITFDQVYKVDSRFFGPAIIHNSRILSKDKLNRLLIDDKTYEWFLLNTHGIENLPIIKLQDLSHLNLSNNNPKNNKSLLFSGSKKANIRNVFCQKLERIQVKEDSFDIYNLMIQSVLSFKSNNSEASVITTVGNMNCNGI